MNGLERKRISTQKDLFENLGDFCRLLRLEGFSVELSSLLSAAEGLRWVNPAELDSFRVMLGAVLAHKKEELEKFQELFREFWLGESFRGRKGPGETGEDTKEGDSFLLGSEQREGPKGEPPHSSLHSVRYSPYSLQCVLSPAIVPVEPTSHHREAMRRFLRPLASRASRRFKLSATGSRFSLGRTLRKNLQHGGDLVYLELMSPRIKRSRLVLLCDVSGSMDEHFRLILEFSHTLLRVERTAEVFLFSTDIARATLHMRTQKPESFLPRIPELVPQWGAGTRIGYCLKTLRQRFGSKVLVRKPVVAIYSDGWDQGEIELLKKEMELLKRKCKALIWLNPLVGTPGYEPTCQGMAAALPFLDLLLPLRSMEDLLGLEREIRRLLGDGGQGLWGSI